MAITATAVAAAPDRMALVSFCTRCFADDHGGSWGAGVMDGGHCLNCGAGGAISLPRWAVEEIRRSASWVGRRYYPQSEDIEIHEERCALLALVPSFPGRTARPAKRIEQGERVPDEGRWEVEQTFPKGCISSTVEASSAEEAIEKTRFGMRYVPARQAKP
jgi:hypothetical protein